MRRVRFRDPAGATRTGEWTDAIECDGRSYDPATVEVLPPCEPTKVVCVGRNYVAHADERDADVPDRPLLFLKPPSAVAGHGATVTLPTGVAGNRIEHEVELGAVVGEQCRDVDPAEVTGVLAGYTVVNDLSNRDDQRRETNWVRGKAFDGAAPMGPVLATPEKVPDDATVECRVDGEIRQRASRGEMVFSVPELVSEVSRFLTLEPGDVIATGTPEGVGPVEDGDRLELTVEGVGTLEHTVRT
ncbi:2-hydroxyhepta-2,4-diene-1,7-dioate isomerase [Halobacteriales archaeon SW_12_71_31]|nr:MAG: 2-hydroxyhepta-2,4-diene-1,7-dioate isomerase [Halobacteriales archaeon SW_12_71_31]